MKNWLETSQTKVWHLEVRLSLCVFIWEQGGRPFKEQRVKTTKSTTSLSRTGEERGAHHTQGQHYF